MLKKVFLVLSFIFLLTGCGKKEDVVTFSTWGSITEIQVLKTVIKKFEQENPDIKINLMHIPQNYFQKLHLLFASNTAPDVIFINNLYLPIYARYLEDLNSYVDKKSFYTNAISSLTYEDKLLAVPRDISSLVFYVNLDKTDLPKSDWKIEDLISKAYSISFEDEIYWATPYLSYFADVDLTDGLSTEELNALNFYKSLRDDLKLAPTKSQIGSSTLAQMFLDEKIVFYLSGRWMYPKITEKAKFNWSVINFPYGRYPQLIDSSGWAINKTSKNKEKSIRFVQYLSSYDVSEQFRDTGLIIPARIDTSQKLNNENHNERVFLETIFHSKPTPTDKNYKKTIDKLNLQYLK